MLSRANDTGIYHGTMKKGKWGRERNFIAQRGKENLGISRAADTLIFS